MHHDIYLFTAEACTVYYGLSEVTWDLTLGYLVLQRWFTLILEHQHDNLDTFFLKHPWTVLFEPVFS